MAHYPITSVGAFGTIVGSIGNSSNTADVLVYNDAEAAITINVQITGTTVVSRTIDKKSTYIFENYGNAITVGPTTLTGGTNHRTSAHTNARVHAFLVVNGTDAPDVPTDNTDE